MLITKNHAYRPLLSVSAVNQQHKLQISSHKKLSSQLQGNKDKNNNQQDDVFQKQSKKKQDKQALTKSQANYHPKMTTLINSNSSFLNRIQTSPSMALKFSKIKQKYNQNIICKIKNDLWRQQPRGNQKRYILETECYANNIKNLPKISTSPTRSPRKNLMRQFRPKQFKVLLINKKKEVFEIVQFIDRGSYGRVCLVQHVQTTTIYCLKIIEKKNLNSQGINQLIRQATIQSYLNHPNIVNLYNFSADTDNVYFLLQACPGQNLYKKMNGKPIKQREVQRYIRQICIAVECMHKNDVIHRDLKPENIIVYENTVKICDFGWSIHSPLLRNTRCGTPLYTPPQMVKLEYYDSKIDIWCIGVLTYELLYGVIPFEITEANDLSSIVDQEVDFPKNRNMSDSAKRFIRKCLQKNRPDRYNIHQALEDQFITGKTQ